MKLKNTFLIGIAAIAGLSSCVNENIEAEGASSDKGIMMLDVSLLKPEATRAQSEVTTYPVIVKDANGNTVANYTSVSEVPSQVSMSVGNYTVISHTPGVIQKMMSYPYYQGEKDMEIMKNLVSEVKVVCTMQNSSIKVNYDSDFLNTFSSWAITIDDGSDAVISFTNEDGETPDAIYYYFTNNVEELVVNFRATTNEGATVSARNTITKSQATESYDNDNTNFSGGDAIVIDFTPVESTEGKVTGISISATVTFEESEGTASLDVTDAGFQEEENQEPTPGPGSDVPITLNLPSNMTVSAATDKSLGDTYIACEKGIKSIKVNIVSTSDEMVSSLQDLSAGYSVDFLSGAEIVGNQNVVQLFNDLNQPLSVPAQGDTEYTFPIGNFFGLLGFLSGDHTFNMVVEDMEGNKKNGSLTLTVE